MSLSTLYQSHCPDCGGSIARCAFTDDENNALNRAFNKAARWVYRSKVSDPTPEHLNNAEVQPLVNAINQVLRTGMQAGITHQLPGGMLQNLTDNVFVFSGAKTFHELKELSELLLDENSHIRPFESFWKETRAIHRNYNRNYLESEYQFATQSARMASKWQQFQDDGDRYMLQYRTANDDRVRPEHWILQDTTLAPSDPFWEKYLPPNGWRCRCTAVQVRRGKYPESDSEQAQQMGERATYRVGKNGQNMDEMFRFNPGKQQVIFPAHHPYLRELSNQEREAVRRAVITPVNTTTDVVELMNNMETGWFEHGFERLRMETDHSNNGSTDMAGTIWLRNSKMTDTINSINKLRSQLDITENEADSLATFWHEITHNRNKLGTVEMTPPQRRLMELANEFVSRNTLPEFYNAFGAQIQHPQFMTNRASTGYNTMVRNYQKIVEKTGLNNNEVVGKVKTHLFNESYADQETGLVNALEGARNSRGTLLTRTDINELIHECDRMTEDWFESYLELFLE